MTDVIGARLRESSRIFYFDPGELDVQPGAFVIVETTRGPELVKVISPRRTLSDAERETLGEIRPVVRLARPADLERLQRFRRRHDEVMRICAKKIAHHGLPMKLVQAEYSFDGARLTFYFVSEQRVDFRELVRDLAQTFRSRIELRQIGPRDETRLLGGIGPCGLVLCCATFQPDYTSISIKMAKEQDLPLNPTKISGLCGRLLCCLSYEYDTYLALRAALPSRGAHVLTPDGPGEVVLVNALQQTVLVRLKSSGMEETYSLESLQHTHPVPDDGTTTTLPEPESSDQWPPVRDRIAEFDITDEDILEALALLENNHINEKPTSLPHSLSRRTNKPTRSRVPKPTSSSSTEPDQSSTSAHESPKPQQRRRRRPRPNPSVDEVD